MKRIILSAGTCLFFCGVVFAGIPIVDYGIAKGNDVDGRAVVVSSITAAILISTGSVTINDYIMYNDGPYDIWIDSSPAVSVLGANQGFKLKVGMSISPDGNCDAMLYGKSVTGDSVVYILEFRNK
jgi:hypothetical protein